MNSELAELLSMYDAGFWSQGDLFYQITLLVPKVSVRTIIDQLPSGLRDEFAMWLRATYDNDLPAGAFVSIGQPQNDLAEEGLRLEALRGWLRTSGQ